jgi:N-methylhydantoinase B
MAASVLLRAKMREQRPERRPFFDRGPGFARLAGTATAEVDWL